jgi:hypothetical protein
VIVKPVCVACQCFFRPEHNGFTFIEGMPLEHMAKRGTAEPEKWAPYKLWRGDLWQCPECAHRIVVGVAGGPIREAYMPDFNEVAESLGGSKMQVNDC